MDIKADEITRIIQRQIEGYESDVDIREVGTVTSVGDGIARIHGLDHAMYNELLEFREGVFGIALNLEEDSVGAVLLGESALIREGDMVKRTHKIMQVPAGPALIGRVVDPLGKPLDGKGPVATDVFMAIERLAPGVVDRQPVREPLQTGIKAIDAIIPIGRGQRELIIGDRQTGKTVIATDTILNQKGTGVICVYVAIGQKNSTVAQIIKSLEDYGAMDYTIVVVGLGQRPFAPPVPGARIRAAPSGEYFRDNGGHALIIYDDLSKHAAAYREISLLLRRPPGREAYPGDVFYLHSRLLERAAKLDDEHGRRVPDRPAPSSRRRPGTSRDTSRPTSSPSPTARSTSCPSCSTSASGPAIDVGISVSRVGGNAQIKAMKQVAGKLRLDLTQYRELQTFAQFGTELDRTSQAQLDRGVRLTEILKQDQFAPLPVEKQILIIYAGNRGFLDAFAVDRIRDYEKKLFAFVDAERPDLLTRIADKKQIDASLDEDIGAALTEFNARFKAEAK